jgi:mycothiol synthase
MSLTYRPLVPSDAPALAALFVAAERVDQTGEHYTEDDVAEELANPATDLSLDTVGVFDGDTMIGVGSVLVRGEERPRQAHAHGVTHPDRRGAGIGTEILDRMMARLRDLQAGLGEPLKALAFGPAEDESQRELVTSVGFEPERWTLGMGADLGDLPGPPPPLPEGYVVRTYTPADRLPLLDAHNEAFLDHPNFSQWSEQEWDQWVVGSHVFRPDLTFLATTTDDPDRIVAYVQTSEFAGVVEATGKREAHVSRVGCRRDHRGKGLAGTLLRLALAAYRDAGFDESALEVDSMNPTGALGIYERAGFVMEHRFINYALVLGE